MTKNNVQVQQDDIVFSVRKLQLSVEKLRLSPTITLTHSRRRCLYYDNVKAHAGRRN